MNLRLKAPIADIRRDNISGAVALTRKAAEVLNAATPESLPEVAALLAAAQPAMASIFNLANAVLLGTATPESFLQRMDRDSQTIAAITAGLLEHRASVMTHSFSETVLNALLSAHREGKRFRVVATESRPVCEGVALARKLGEAGIPVTLVIDAAMLSALDGVALVLVGADNISIRGVTNKIGTAPLALAAKTLGKRIYALCGSEKLFPAGSAIPAEAGGDPAEILREPIANTTVSNRYFEVTPLQWFTGIITEDGAADPAGIPARLRTQQVHPALL